MTSSTSSGRLTRSSNNSSNKTETTITAPPARKASRVLRRILGDEGLRAGLASSNVVTSDTRVTEMIFSAATSRRAFAIRLASSGCAFFTVIDTIRVSTGTVTWIFLLNPLTVFSSLRFEMTFSSTSCEG